MGMHNSSLVFINKSFVPIGLQSLNTDEWIEIDCHYRKYIAVKRDLLNERNEAVFMFKDGTETASREVLDMLVDYLPQRFPNMFRKTANGIDNLITNESFDLVGNIRMHPLNIASRLIQEDLVIMQHDPQDGLYHANVCQTSRRNLSINTVALFHF